MRFSNLRNGLILTTSLLAILHGKADAQTADPAVALSQVEQNIKDSSDKQATLATDIEAATKAQAEISDKLIELAKTLESQQTAVQTADGNLKKLSAESIVIRSTLAEKQDRLSELLAGLQRLEQNPPPALVVEPQNILQALRGAMMFGAVVPEMRDQAQDLQNNLHRLETIKTETEDTKKSQEAALAALALSKTELTQLQSEKKALAASSAKDLTNEKLRSASLAKEAKNLKQLLAALEEEKKKAEALKTAEAKILEETERKKREALMRPMMVFTEAQGKLDYPVQGNKLKQFGDDNGLGGRLDGLAIAASADSNVISPVDGRVEFAGPFRSYGQLLILNVGEGYLVLLAGMNQISAEIGQSIRAGEPLGQMGKGPSSVALIGSETNNAQPVLYIEFRKNNDPVDPSPWWIGGRKEAMK